jgi:hypothetical protein
MTRQAVPSLLLIAPRASAEPAPEQQTDRQENAEQDHPTPACDVEVGTCLRARLERCDPPLEIGR